MVINMNEEEEFTIIDEDETEIEIIEDDGKVLHREKKKNIFGRIADGVRRFKRNRWGGIVWQLVTSLIMLVIAAGIGIFLAVGKVKGGPEIFAGEYFEYFIHGNWYNMYNATDIEESEFISMSAFSRFMSQRTLEGEVTDYEVEVLDRDDETSHVRINYNIAVPAPAEENTEGETSEGTPVEEEEPPTVMTKGSYEFTLKRQPENILWIYTTWKGDMDSFIIKDCTIETPSYVSPIFDGVNIKGYLVGTNEETGNSIYKIDRVFEGKHTIELTGEFIDNRTEEVIWDADNASYVVNSTDIPIKEEYRAVMEQQALNLVVTYYSEIFTGGNSDTIRQLIMEDEAAYAHVDEQFAAMQQEINHEDGRTLVNMEIASYTCTAENYKYMESIEVKVNYTANYNAKTGRTILNGVRRDYTGTNTASARVYFKYVDNTWKASGIDISCIDYTVENVEEGS